MRSALSERINSSYVKSYGSIELKCTTTCCNLRVTEHNSNLLSKLIDKYDMYHGGFIWDFIDQAILVKDQVTGKEVLRYGGDFDDKPADYEFSANGIVFADRKEKPAMQEVRYYYGLYR